MLDVADPVVAGESIGPAESAARTAPLLDLIESLNPCIGRCVTVFAALGWQSALSQHKRGGRSL
jgi:hypothetical protein